MSGPLHDAGVIRGKAAARARAAPITVAVVDENDIFRHGIVACLRADTIIDVTFEGRSGPMAGVVDVVVVSRSALVRLRLDGPVVICCDQPRSIRVPVGRVAAVLPRASLTERQLVAGVRAAASGLQVGVPRPRAASASTGEIPARGIETLRLLAAGCGTREISAAIGYSERTVKAVIANTERRLGARTRAHLVAEAIRQGWI